MKLCKYSLEEVKSAGLTVKQLKFNGHCVDTRRSTCLDSNIAALKKLELKTPPKHPAASAEKKAKKAEKKTKVKKEKSEEKPAKQENAVASKVAKLEDFAGISDKDIAKLKDLGIDSPAKLASEDIKELSKLSKITQKQLKAWVDQMK
jgi:predicted flap endonuclease-1-like 5' DNA nuclease